MMAKRFTISEKVLKTEIRNAAHKAIRENKALGINTTALMDGNIVEITPEGSITIIKHLNLPPQKPIKKHYILG